MPEFTMTVGPHMTTVFSHPLSGHQVEKGEVTASSRLREYQLIEQAGKGCFAVVYHAIHTATQRDVALKVIPKSVSNVQTIRTEILALHRLRGHRNIVQLYDVFDDQDNVYMAMEWCPGGNLHDFLVRQGRLDEITARFWFRQLLSAVSFCQQKGVVSRDIKNSNVILDEQGNVKLADFGLAVLVGNVDTDCINQSAGSAVFAAPEVYCARERPYAVVPSEMWALGAVLHSMVKRALPFPHEQYSSHWRQYNPPEHVSASLQHLLTWLLTFEPTHRPTIVEVIAHPWMCGQSAVNGIAHRQPSEPSQLASRRRSLSAYNAAFKNAVVLV